MLSRELAEFVLNPSFEQYEHFPQLTWQMQLCQLPVALRSQPVERKSHEGLITWGF